MIRFHKEAAAEMKASFKFYESQRPGLGSRFLEMIETAVEKIQSHPQAWPPLKVEANPLRRCLLKDFPFGIIYEVENRNILIWAITHLSRKPDYWGKRHDKRGRKNFI